jgi:hypothetical protein
MRAMRARLPDFFKLTLEVARRLGVHRESTVGQLIETERQYRASGSISQLHLSISFDRIFTALVRDFGVVQVEREVVAVLAPRRRPKLDGHRALLDIARGPDGHQRLVTTNFDRLFQKAQPRLRTYAPPHFPDLSRRDGFDGVMHLHSLVPAGSPAKRFSESLGLVLSSGDFGRAYLADGWATRFICDLLDRYTVVLLGYSADDPPVRYLLEGLNLSGRIRERRLYALAAGDSEQVAADWRERGVTAIGYNSEDQHRHLWETIHGWAERARDPAAWRRQVTALAITPPQQLKAFERGQVAALCSSSEGAQEFASAKPPPPAEWLCVFDAACRFWKPGTDVSYTETPAPEIDPLVQYGLDDDPPRPQDPRRDQKPLGIDLLSPLGTDDPAARECAIVTISDWMTNPLNPRLFQMARWIQSVMGSSATVWWAASRRALHPTLRQQLSWTLESETTVIEPFIRDAWRLVLEALNSAPDNTRDGWWGIQTQIKREGWSTRTIREFSIATRPRITVQRPWARAPVPPDNANLLSLSRIAHFEVHYPKLIEDISTIPDQKLAAVLEAIRNNLELGVSLEAEISQVHLRLPTLYPENKPGQHIYNESEEYYVKFARLFERLAKFNPKAARREYLRWDGAGRFFIVLRIWGLANPKVVAAAEAGRALRKLDRETFWKSDYARELLWAVRARWSTLSQRDRRAIESKILQGRSKYNFETDKEYLERRSSLTAGRLIWMRDAGLKLSRSTIARLPALKKANPHWRASWADQADASLEGRSGWIKQDTEPTPLVTLPIPAVIARCEELAQRQFESFTDRDPFRGLVTAMPQRALDVLIYEGRRKNYPGRYWSRLLSDWPKNATRRLMLRVAAELSGMLPSTLVEIRFELCRWMEAYFAKIDSADPNLGRCCFDHIVEALKDGGDEALISSLGKTSVGGVEIPSNRMGISYAINSPTGDLAQGLIQALFARKPKRNQQIPKDLKARIEVLIVLPDEGGQHALTVIARQLHGLFAIDPNWTRTFLLPRFDPAHKVAEAAWSGFLAASLMPSPSLFNIMKKYFLRAIGTSSSWTCEELKLFGQLLILGLEPARSRRRLLSFEEARNALRSASAIIRQEALWFLRTRAKLKDAWSNLIVPFFQQVWPKEQKFQTAETTRRLLLFVEELDERFSEGVELIVDYLTPSPEVDLFVFQFGSEGEHGRARLTQQFPHEVLVLLDKIVDAKRPHPPYGLAQVLTQIADAAPTLRHDERWQRLHRLII